MNEHVAMKFYTVILWRSTVPTLLYFIATELVFFMIYQLRLGCIATVIFLLILYNILRFIQRSFMNLFEPYIFPHTGNEALFDELREVSTLVSTTTTEIYKQISNYVQNPTLNGNLIFYGSALILLIILTILGNFWCWYIINYSWYVLYFVRTKIYNVNYGRKNKT